MLLLIIPSLNYDIYMSFSAILLLAIFKIESKEKITNLIFLVSVMITVLMIRGVLNNDIQEIKETIKFSYITVILTGSFEKKYRKALVEVNNIFFTTLFLIIILQWVNPFSEYWKQLVGIIYSEGHYIGGIRSNFPRATGIMSNVAEASIYFCLSSINYFQKFRLSKKSIYILAYIAAVLGVILTQSKTVLLIQLLITIIHLTIFSNNWIRLLVAAILFLSMSEIIQLLKSLDQIQRLMEVGFATSSMSFRINSWIGLINSYIDSSIIEIIFGIGRSESYDYILASTLDSDFFYTLQNFGLIGLIICFYFFIKYLKKCYTFRKCVTYSMICLIPAFFFLDVIFNPKIIIFTYLFLQLFNHENSICTHKLQRSDYN